jgi:hypothetical protein
MIAKAGILNSQDFLDRDREHAYIGKDSSRCKAEAERKSFARVGRCYHWASSRSNVPCTACASNAILRKVDRERR